MEGQINQSEGHYRVLHGRPFVFCTVAVFPDRVGAAAHVFVLVRALRGKVTGFGVSCLATFRVARDAYGTQIEERPTNRFWLSPLTKRRRTRLCC